MVNKKKDIKKEKNILMTNRIYLYMRYQRPLTQLWPIGIRIIYRLHPQDDRKIKTYLDIYVETGKKPSEFVQ